MKLTILGTSAGSPPLSERRHAALALACGEGLYWFDTGEDCARAAFLAGVNLLATRAVFVSHMAMDHIGGLPPLLWALRKLNNQVEKSPLDDRVLRILVPDARAWRGVLDMIEGTTRNRFARDFILRLDQFHDGVVYEEDGVRVAVRHNSHLGAPKPGGAGYWTSYGFRVEADGKSFVYSGDMGTPEELAPLLEKPCDLLLVDGAHHDLEVLGRFLNGGGFSVARAGLFHLGRDAQRDMAKTRRDWRELLGARGFVAEDGMTIEL